MKNKILLLSLIGILICLSNVFAQQDSTKRTQKAQFEISEKSFSKEVDFELTPKTPVFEYVEVESAKNLDIQTENWLDIDNAIVFAKPYFYINANEQAPILAQKRYPNYLKVGFGNYITPLFEGFYTLSPSEKNRYGVFVRHISSMQGVKDKQNSAYGNTNALLFSTHQFQKAELATKINYELERSHYYGYNDELAIPDAKDIRQTYHRLENEVRFRSVKTFSLEDAQKFGYEVSLGLNLMNANPQITEIETPLQTKLSYEINKKFTLFWNTDVNYTSLSDSIHKQQRVFVTSSPSLNFTTNKLTLNIGAGVAYSNDDSLTVEQAVFVYPNVSVSYQVMKDKVWANASITGGIEGQFFRTESRLNPFLSPLQQLSHSFKQYDAQVGVQTKLVENLEVNAKLGLANYKNLAFFAPAITDSSQFALIYDDATIFSLQVASCYQKKNIDVRFSASYFGYSMENLAVAHHRPNVETHFALGYTAFEKIRFGIDFRQFFGLETQNLVTKTTYKLRPIHHLNAEVSYQITPQLSAFVTGYNLVGGSYQRFLNYPVNGITGLIGGKYIF